MYIEKLIHQFGFKVYYDLSDRNHLGYLYYGSKKMIVIKKTNIKEEYIIASLLEPFLRSEEKEEFFLELNEIDYDNIINLLIPDSFYKRIPSFCRNEKILSKLFQVEPFIVEQKIYPKK